MVTAWKDAEEIAIIADQWRTQKRDETLVDAAGKKKRKWQDAMDYYMGKDSLKDDATNSRIEFALENERKAHEGNWLFPEAVIDIYCGSHPTKNACPLQTDPGDPTRLITAFARSWVDRGIFWNTYNIVLCPRFFSAKDSLWGILDFMQKGHSDPRNATEYKRAWGHTIYHERMHLDPVIADREVWDVLYGPCRVARLANYNGCTGNGKFHNWDPAHGKPNSMNNGDSWAMFASAAYFQSKLGLDRPGEPPNCDINVRPDQPYKGSDTVEGIRLPPGDMPPDLFNARVPPEPTPEQEPAPEAPAAELPIDSNSPPKGLGKPFADAEKFLI